MLVVNMRIEIKTGLQHSRFASKYYWQYQVLGHHQRPEIEAHQSVNTQLPTAEDGVGFLRDIRKQNVSVEDQLSF